ncbi:PEP-CTERM sorting domain-containing protein [Adhaeretor mobilis]|uniref:Ice-binding protein C-terminal domain-containing protein n=1 Tax=Adhaeretor mobilis TaxID=1930276 RepID=A0A517MUQ7_9BACT|nr:PEP-CTERM sorting domain-containing protein [Adhaeretor mobilis]QDS98623.1 hypothetical protein HG15A2_19040 [Adhaeretor mobilis]
MLCTTRIWVASFLLTLTFSVVSATADIVIDEGPTYSPPGAGAIVGSGTGNTFAGGRTFTITGTDLGQTANLYLGIKNDLYLTGFSMDGGGISGSEIFRFDSVTLNSIIYTGDTLMQFSDSEPDFTSPTRLTMTFGGAGTIIQDGTTAALSNTNADVGALWRVEGDFTVNFLIEATVPPFASNAGNYEPGNDLFNRLDTTLNSTGTSVDFGYYYETAAVPEPSAFLCFGLVAMGFVVRKKIQAGHAQQSEGVA